MRILLIALLLWYPFELPSACAGDLSIERYSFGSVAKAIVLASTTSAKQTVVRDVDAEAMTLSLAYARTNASLDALLDVSEFYLGEAHSEALTSAFTVAGQRISKKLAQRQRQPVRCMNFSQDEIKRLTPEGVRCLGVEERNQRLVRFADLIKEGVVVPYEL